MVKAGNGTLVLTNPANVAITQPLVINAGVVRAQPGSSLPFGELEFRGGVLEITGGGTFARTVGFGPGNLTWAGIDSTGSNISQQRGSGGFSAFGADVTVDLERQPAPSNLTVERTTALSIAAMHSSSWSRTANASARRSWITSISRPH